MSKKIFGVTVGTPISPQVVIDKTNQDQKIGAAVKSALADAKASGEFKGDKGDPGEQGSQGVQGEKGDTGETGADGYTPVKGTDYFTPEDVEAIAAQAAAKVTPVTYTLTKDENGDIVLTGSDGSANTVTDETASGEDYSGMQMLINEEVSATSFSTTNTRWRFAIIEIIPNETGVDNKYAVLTPYHLTGQIPSANSNISIYMSRSSGKTTWTLQNGAGNSYLISRVRAYR